MYKNKHYALRDIRNQEKHVFNPELRVGFVNEENSNDYVDINDKKDKEYASFLEITKDYGCDNFTDYPHGYSVNLTRDEAEFLYQTLKKLRKYFKLIPTTSDFAACP